jgi:ketosteroid isomerase-like protein
LAKGQRRESSPGYDRAEVSPESQIELTRRAIDAFNSNNAEAMIELGVLEFDWSGSIAPNQGVYRGEEGVREFVDDQWSMFQELRIEPEEFLTRGRHVIVPITVHGRGRDGLLVKATSAQLYTFEDGRPARITLFQSRDEALEAAGARP